MLHNCKCEIRGHSSETADVRHAATSVHNGCSAACAPTDCTGSKMTDAAPDSAASAEADAMEAEDRGGSREGSPAAAGNGQAPDGARCVY